MQEGDKMFDKNAQTKLYNTLMGNPTTGSINNSIGRVAGLSAANGSNDNFFTKKWKSIDNAIGTTGAAIASAAKDAWENTATENLLQDNTAKMNEVAKKYGYNTYHDIWDARDRAEANGDTATLNFIDNTINPELQAQANVNAQKADEKAANYKDYMENNDVSKRINQDPGKFAGSAINTLSTATDIMGLTNGPISNAIQGGIEGVADELEQNGLENFSWERAGQNALTGAAAGAAVGAINNTGLVKNLGNGKISQAVLNSKLGQKTLDNALGKGLRTVGAGAARGAISGAVGGATGAGVSSAINGVDLGQGIANTFQGATEGAKQGAATGAIMTGANSVLNKVPVINDANKAAEDFRNLYEGGEGNRLQRAANAYRETARADKNWGGKVIRNLAGDKYNDWIAEPANYEDIGLRYNQFSNNPRKAIDYLMKRRQGEVEGAVQSKTLENITGNGNVDLVYGKSGKDGFGLSHIAEKHGTDALYKIPEILQNGEVYTRPNSNRLFMSDPNGDGVVALDYNGNKKQWVITAFDAENPISGDSRYTKVSGTGSIPGNALNDMPITDIIPQSNKNVNPMDSPSQMLNSNAQDLLMDRNGNRKIMYHGSPNSFDKFDTEMIGSNSGNKGLLGEGFYFTDDKSLAEDYALGSRGIKSNNGMIYEADLNVKKPFYWNNIKTEAEMNALAKELGLDDGILRWNKNNNGGEMHMLDRDGESEIVTNALKNKGYDSVVYQHNNAGKPGAVEVSVFSPEQIVRTNNTPETEVYRTLTGDNQLPTSSARTTWDDLAKEYGYKDYNEVSQKYLNDNPNSNPDATDILDWLDRSTAPMNNDVAKQRLRNIKAEALRTRAAEDLLNQVGTAKAPAAKADNMVENVKQFMDEGLTKPEEWQLASDAITGANGVMSRLHRNLVSQAGNIDTYAGLGGKYGDTIDETIDYMIKAEGLVDSDAKGIKNEIMAVINSLPSRIDGSISSTDSAESVMDGIRELEAHRRNYLGEDSRNRSTTTPYKDQKARVIKKVTSMLEDRIYDNIPDAKTVVTQDAINELKSYFPGNKKWQASVDKKFDNIKTGKDLRAAQKRYVQTSDYLRNIKENYGTYGQRVGDVYGNALSQAVKKVPVIGGLLAQATNTPFMNRRYADINMTRANKLKGDNIVDSMANIPSRKSIPNTPAIDSSNIPNMPSQTNKPVIDAVSNPSTQIFNAIGREIGQGEGEQARAAAYLSNAVQEAETAPTSLEGLIVPSTGTATSVYNNIYGQPSTTTTTVNTPTTGGYFQATGDYWTDLIGRAMSRAIDEDDVTAFATLYGMYQDALSKNSSDKDYSNPVNWSSTDRKSLLQAQNGLDQIDSLKQSYINAVGDGSNVMQGTLRQWANNISGGNLDPSAENYVKQANSIGAGIIKNLVNLGSTEYDAERYIDYLPKLTDTKEQAAQKLQVLRDAYNNVIGNLKTIYNV